MVVEPCLVDEVETGETQDGAHHTHQGTSGDEAAGYQRALLATGLVHGLVLGACGHKPVDGATYEQRGVEFDGDEHAQGKGQGWNLAYREDDGDDGTDGIEQPGRTHTIHQWVDDGGHGIGLGSSQVAAGESVGLVEQDHHATHGSGRHQRAEEFPCLLLLGSGAQPVAHLQVGDECAGH